MTTGRVQKSAPTRSCIWLKLKLVFRLMLKIKGKKKFFLFEKIQASLGHKKECFYRIWWKKNFFCRRENSKTQKPVFSNFLKSFEVMWKNVFYKSCRSFYYLQLLHSTFFDRRYTFLGNRKKPFFTPKSTPHFTTLGRKEFNLFFPMALNRFLRFPPIFNLFQIFFVSKIICTGLSFARLKTVDNF